MMKLTRTVTPTDYPIDLEEVKQHSRVYHSDDDVFLQGLIAAATDYLDGPSGILGKAMITQEWLLELPSWCSDIPLPIEPVQAVTVSYIDANGEIQAVADADFDLEHNPSQRTVLRWQRGIDRPTLQSDHRYPVRLTITAGFGAAHDVPAGVKVAMHMMISHWFLNREAVSSGAPMSDVPMGASALLARWRAHL